jgi:hypothetical protein
MKKILLSLAVILTAILSGHSQGINDPFFDKVSFKGAFGTTDWTIGWTNFNPQTTVYPAATQTINAGDITTNTNWSSGSPLLNGASFTNAALSDPFFDQVSFVGAFGTTDWTSGWANFNPQTTVYPATTITIPAGDITTNTTWSAGNVYLLNGWVYVKAGATLTIEPGTIIRGDKVNKGALIIEKGATINANGTASNPIVFTSNQAAGSRDYGDWGGVIILGNAVINVAGGSATIEGGVGSIYGGTNDADNSGIFRYVRIEFPGIAFVTNSEINGLTMGGVGSATQLDHIQVSYSGDDSFEWFGGTVNAKYLIALRGWDDEFDTDFGFRGKIQYGVSLRDPNIGDVSGSNGFESDNDGSGSTNTPATKPIFSNMSFYGPKVTSSTTVNSNYKRAMHIRRNSQLNVFNSVFAGYPTGLFIDASNTQANATNGLLNIENCIMAGMTTNFASTFEDTYFNTPSRHNSILSNNTSLQVVNPFNLTAPNFLPSSTGNVYLLNGWVYVKAGATLTIEPGTIIRGDKTNKGALVIEKGATIIANGTAIKPIVFTSNQAAGSRDYGDWGGVVILGNAVINVPGGSATIEGGLTSTYGGTNDADNSGIFRYVRIEFPGIAFVTNSEINGLTMGGVGSATQIDHVQVSYSGDDSYEWFGGTVNAKYLIAFRGWDDEFDTDFGFRGKIQYGVSLRDPNIADVSGSNGFESDNDASGSTNIPVTNPIFSNMSFFGPKVTSSTTINSNFKRAMHLRRNTQLNVYNSVFAGYPTGLFIDATAAQTNATNGLLNIENCILAGMGATTYFASDFERNYYKTVLKHNDTLVNNTELMVTDGFNLTSPNFMPQTGSPLLNGSYWKRIISGKLSYDNTANTPMTFTKIYLVRNTIKIDSVFTNASGDFRIVADTGTYSLNASSTKAWGGVTSGDALQVRKHSAAQITLTGLKFTASDVNKSGSVTSGDGLFIRRRGSLGETVSQWTAENWLFENPTFTIIGENLIQNFKAICSGDANGSFVPAQ